MSKPARTTTRRSVRTREFIKAFEQLPSEIKSLAERIYEIFCAHPDDERLRTNSLEDSKKAKHRDGSYSVQIGYRYRAIYVIDRGPNNDEAEQYCWYWIGSHESYNNFIGSK